MLRVPEAGRYTLSLWWPDSDVAVRSKWARAMSATVVSASGARSEPTTLDLTSQGGDQWVVAAGGEGEGVQLEPGDTLEVACPAGGGDCIADAVLVESAARWNDGSVASNVTLQPTDSIVLNSYYK